MNIQHSYNQWATTYDMDRNLTRDLDQIVTTTVLTGHEFQSTLEIGCGTGKNTSFYTQISRKVTAMDFSIGMMKQAQTKIQSGVVCFTMADLAQTWPLRNHSFDLIACDLVLEHLPDLDAIFAEAARMLVAKGSFFICELHPFRQYEGKKAVITDGAIETRIDAYTHHISDFLHAASNHKFTLIDLQEWWHPQDQNKPPRLVSFLFESSPILE